LLVNYIDEYGRTPLHYASIYNFHIVAKLLLENVATLNCVDIFKRTPLHYASIYNNYLIVEMLMNKSLQSVDARDCQDNGGNTPLHYAADGGFVEVVKILLYSGAYIDIKNTICKTPLMLSYGKCKKLLLARKLHYLIFENDVDGVKNCVDTLLEYGGDIEEKNLNNQTPLASAICLSDVSVDIVRILLKNNADVNIIDGTGMSLLHIICYKINSNFEDTDRLNIIFDLLIKFGANINAQTQHYHETPLHIAVRRSLKLIKKIISINGVDLNIKNVYGNTPIEVATTIDSQGIKEAFSML
jgi:ankyrin repeat protein